MARTYGRHNIRCNVICPGVVETPMTSYLDTPALREQVLSGLEQLVGHLDVLDGRDLPLVHGAHEAPGAPGLWFTGYTNPISGMLRELRIDAERIAEAISREGARSPA